MISTKLSVTSCTCKRSFSKLTQVKFKLRSTMNQKRLNALMVLTVEREITVNVHADAKFVDDFKIAVDFKRRMSYYKYIFLIIFFFIISNDINNAVITLLHTSILIIIKYKVTIKNISPILWISPLPQSPSLIVVGRFRFCIC
jgi:hypothetical protein